MLVQPCFLILGQAGLGLRGNQGGGEDLLALLCAVTLAALLCACAHLCTDRRRRDNFQCALRTSGLSQVPLGHVSAEPAPWPAVRHV